MFETTCSADVKVAAELYAESRSGGRRKKTIIYLCKVYDPITFGFSSGRWDFGYV